MDKVVTRQKVFRYCWSFTGNELGTNISDLNELLLQGFIVEAVEQVTLQDGGGFMLFFLTGPIKVNEVV